MRLFYAINFKDNIKESLNENINEIRKHTLRGNFTEKNNFHITLVFIGECEPDKLESLKKVAENTVSKINPKQMKATVNGLGTFVRPGDELLWAGVKINPEDINTINKINKNITEELSEYNIKISENNKKFTPHVTIARRVEFKTPKNLNNIKFEPVNFTIDSLTLMESIQEIKISGDRQYTKIVYNQVYEVKF